MLKTMADFESLMIHKLFLDWSAHTKYTAILPVQFQRESLEINIFGCTCLLFLHASIDRVDIQIPVDLSLLSIPILQPRVGLLEMPTVELHAQN